MNKNNYLGLILVIASILIYSLATSGDVVCTNESERIAKMAMWGTWVQAGAAIITLGIMIWLGYRQNELVRKQISVDLYEKRYEVYSELLNLMEECGSLKPIYDLKGNSQEQTEYIFQANEFWFKIKPVSEKIPFLFEKQSSENLMEIIEKEIKALDNLITFNIERMNQVYTNYDSMDTEAWERNKQEKENKVRQIKEEFKTAFKEYLSFGELE